jgi:hypothetical protein
MFHPLDPNRQHHRYGLLDSNFLKYLQLLQCSRPQLVFFHKHQDSVK